MAKFSWPGVYVQEVPAGGHPIPGVPTSIAAFVGAAAAGPLDAPARVKSFGEFHALYGRGEHPLAEAVRLFFLNGGGEAWIARAGDQASAPDAQRSALALLDQVARFNILCLPPVVHGADVGTATWQAAADYAKARDAIVLVDPPAAWQSAADVQAGIATLVTPSDSVFVTFPRLRVADGAGQVIEHAPCGAIAGLIARTDAQRGVWHAAAGAAALITGVRGPAHALSDVQIGLIHPLGVNVLRTLPGGALVMWGARMFVPGPPPVYAPVRRMQLFIRQSLAAGLDWVVFEPNDEPLWAQVRTSVTAFMQDLFAKGAFAGNKPGDAFFARCDRTTMTQNDIDNGRLILQVGFAALKPAEFVTLAIEQTTGH